MKKSIKITLKNVKERCKRENSEANNKLHWFSSKFSIYFSYLLIKLRITADQATIMFFILGLLGSVFYSFNSIELSILGYIFFRLHIIVDMSDGDIARFNKSYSIRGAYWDSVIHSIVNPTYYILIAYSFFLQFDDTIFLILCAFIGLSSSVLMSVKNNYYKAMLFNKKELEVKKVNEITSKSWRFKIFFFVSEALSIEGFILLTLVIRFLDIKILALFLLALYICANILASCIKFYQLSYKGSYQTKS